MKNWNALLKLALSCALAALGANSLGADTRVNPYESIAVRNPFGIRPPPEPPPPPPVEKPAVNIKLTGISTLSENKRAMLIVTEPNGKPEYFTMSEGEKQGALEVLEIDEVAGKVKVNNAGNVTLMSFESHGNRPQAAPTPPPPVPGLPPGLTPGSVVPLPQQPNQAGIPQPIPPTGNTQVLPLGTQQNQAPSPVRSYGAPVPTQNPPTPDNLRTIPTRILRTTPGPQSQTIEHVPKGKELSADVGRILYEVNNEINKVDIQKGNYPPPLPLD